MKLLKLRKAVAKESLARARKRVKASLMQAAISLTIKNVLHDGEYGYLRDWKIYG